MELCAGAALTGMGYLLNKQRDALRKSGNGVPESRDKPSMNNVYASDYWSAVKRDELRRGTEMTNNAKTPFTTGVVPKPAYASMFASEEYLKTYTGQSSVSSLSGEEIPIEQFTHNNMQPFFAGKVTQNVDGIGGNLLLDRHTGRNDDVKIQRAETKCFFEPTAHMTHVCGMPDNSEYYMERIVKPIQRNNEFPIEQVRVAPGLGLGYTAMGSGGFQQASTLDYVKEKTVDELRPLSKPKVTLEGRIQGPARGVTTERGVIGKVSKNRPDTSYEQTEDQWITTTGANMKQSLRPVNIVKPTARVDTHTPYIGTAVGSVTQPGKGESHDYGKSSITVYNNERQTTETKTVVTNLTSMVKAIVAPFMDIFRHTPKDYTLDAGRIFGNMSAQIPEKPTVYDPVNHMMRTTIKETTIHDTTVANLKGPEAGMVYAEDNARTTTRETLPIEDTTRNMSGRTYRVIMYNPDEVAKKTLRELCDAAPNEAGYVNPFNAEGAYNYIEVKLPHTQKQYMSDYEYYGGSESKTDFRPTSQEADRNAEIDGTREAINIAAGHTPGAGGLFVSTDATMVNQDTKRAISDDLAARQTGNIGRVYQNTPLHMNNCELTRGMPSVLNGNETRLDPTLLNSLKTNPYNLNINPLAAD